MPRQGQVGEADFRKMRSEVLSAINMLLIYNK